MDKKVFLLDKQHYTREMVANLTEKDLEEWVAEEDYDDNHTIIKIDCNGFESADEAISDEFEGMIDANEYYIFVFGF